MQQQVRLVEKAVLSDRFIEGQIVVLKNSTKKVIGVVAHINGMDGEEYHLAPIRTSDHDFENFRDSSAHSRTLKGLYKDLSSSYRIEIPIAVNVEVANV